MSTTDSIKNSASEAAAEEPNAKKAKLTDEDDNKNVDNNNGLTANKQVDNKVSSSDAKSGPSDASKVPSKAAANGSSDKEQTKTNTEHDDDEDEDVFDPKIQSQLEAVEDIQQQISKLNELASEEILKVEQKYNKLRRPHFEKRNSLLKDVPNFWLTTLANHPIITSMILESSEDEDCLHYMVNLDVEEFEDIKSGYKLNFHFIENPYIKNEVVTREIRHVNNEEVVTVATVLEYKDTPQGNNLKQLVERSMAQLRRQNAASRMHMSFFGWLTHSMDESGTDEIAEIIKDQIWPSPLEFFFSAPDEYGDGSDESDDEEDYDEDADNDVEGADIPEEEYIDDELDNEELDDDDDDDEDEDEDEDEE